MGIKSGFIFNPGGNAFYLFGQASDFRAQHQYAGPVFILGDPVKFFEIESVGISFRSGFIGGFLEVVQQPLGQRNKFVLLALGSGKIPFLRPFVGGVTSTFGFSKVFSLLRGNLNVKFDNNSKDND